MMDNDKLADGVETMSAQIFHDLISSFVFYHSKYNRENSEADEDKTIDKIANFNVYSVMIKLISYYRNEFPKEKQREMLEKAFSFCLNNMEETFYDGKETIGNTCTLKEIVAFNSGYCSAINRLLLFTGSVPKYKFYEHICSFVDLELKKSDEERIADFREAEQREGMRRLHERINLEGEEDDE